MKEEFITKSEFARRVGRSAPWIHQLVKMGKLPTNDDGKIPYKAGVAAMETSKDPARDAQREHGAKLRDQGAAKRERVAAKAAKDPAAAIASMMLPDDETSLEQISVSEVNTRYNKAKLAEKTYQAKLKELEYQEAKGMSIPIDLVESDAAKTGAAIRERLLAVPPRVAGICEGRPAREIEVIIADAINDALTALRDSRFGKK